MRADTFSFRKGRGSERFLELTVQRECNRWCQSVIPIGAAERWPHVELIRCIGVAGAYKLNVRIGHRATNCCVVVLRPEVSNLQHDGQVGSGLALEQAIKKHETATHLSTMSCKREGRGTLEVEHVQK